MKLRNARHLGLLVALAAAGSAPLLANCAAPESGEGGPLSEDAVTGVNNPLGLGLRYDEATGRVQATLQKPLESGERLFVRVRRGKLTLSSQKDLKCADLTEAPVAEKGTREVADKVVYAGPKVDKSIIDLLHLYDDPRWANDTVSDAQRAEVAKGPDPIVEACILKGDTVRAKLQTNLAQAWSNATKDKKVLSTQSARLRIRAEDGGLEGDDAGEAPVDVDGGSPVEPVDAGPPVPRGPLTEFDDIESQQAYAEVCVSELGEIPFFPKLADGKYGTFDCRDFAADDGKQGPRKIEGVEGNDIPLMVDNAQVTTCDPETPLGPDDHEYNCRAKCDRGMYLDPGACQPGPTVTTAKNEKGTHWVLLCRKVSDTGTGMMKSKMFNDIAMIGHNPETGRTCFFQNSINSGRDGEHVTHPADKEKSTHIWSSYVQSYCTGSCHAADPFVHSSWIDGAKRANGTPIVPKMGNHPDFQMGNPDAFYNLVAADKVGFEIPKHLVSEEADACTSCHRLGGNTLGYFADYSTGTGDDYMSKLTDFGKKFENSHWMPPRLGSVTEANWKTSKYGKALEFMRKCEETPEDPACIWSDVPRGAHNNPSITPRNGGGGQ